MKRAVLFSANRRLAVKRFYWNLRERAGLYFKRRHFYYRLPWVAATEVWEQVKVLVVFFSSLGSPSETRLCNSSPSDQSGRQSILMISFYAWPYKPVYGTERTSTFIKYLSKLGWRIHLLTSVPRGPHEIDSGSESFPESSEVIRVKHKNLDILCNKALAIPDDFIGWVLPAIKQTRNVLKSQQIDLLYATAPPYSNLLVGAICSKKFAIPLISDFRDPWTKIDIGWKIDRPFLRWLNGFLERSVLKISRKVIMVDEKKYLEDYFLDGRRYDNKIETITNGFDEENFASVTIERENSKKNRFVLSYVGTIYDEACFETLVKPLEMWKSRHPDDFRDVFFEYAGRDSRLFQEYRSTVSLIDHGYLSHEAAVAIRSNAVVQLFCQPLHFKPHVLSGKIYEMIRTGICIVAYTHPNGAVASLLQRTQTGYVIRPGDYESAARLLKSLFEKWRAGLPFVSPKWECVMEYKREKLAAQLSELMLNVLRENPYSS